MSHSNQELEERILLLETKLSHIEQTFSWVKGTVFGGSLILGAILWIWEQLKSHISFQ